MIYQGLENLREELRSSGIISEGLIKYLKLISIRIAETFPNNSDKFGNNIEPLWIKYGNDYTLFH